MEILRIEWETGYMELSIKAFFPCNLQKARKIAPLINRYCTEEDRAYLLSELHGMVEFYQEEIQRDKGVHEEVRRRYAAMGSMANPKRRDEMFYDYETRIRKNEALKKRVERNIDCIERGEKNGKKKR